MIDSMADERGRRQATERQLANLAATFADTLAAKVDLEQEVTQLSALLLTMARAAGVEYTPMDSDPAQWAILAERVTAAVRAAKTRAAVDAERPVSAGDFSRRG